MLEKGHQDHDGYDLCPRASVELRPLTKVLRIFEGERMELEDITEYGEVLILRSGEVDPEEAATREQALEIAADEVQFANLFFMHYMKESRLFDRPFTSRSSA